MFTHTDWLIHLEHHKDLLREAEKERLAKTALSALRARKAEKKANPQQIERSKSQTARCCKTVAV
ncbi:MAG: hypothetical protein C4557_00725 [Anaerolineaceae bacterium]|jgi:hypothetical protein|nr:MAG: hypothetical protein C4557_00725 [Anaerolineaceae bacterium]